MKKMAEREKIYKIKKAFDKEQIAHQLLAIMMEFQFTDTVKMAAVGGAVETMERIAKLFSYHGTKVIKEERVKDESEDNLYMVVVTMKRNAVT